MQQQTGDNAIKQIESRTNHHKDIEGMGGADAKGRELDSIKETDLDSAGKAKRSSEEYKFYDENELEPDYTKPGNYKYKKDSDEIVNASERIMHALGANLIKKLGTEGFDCKTPGADRKEPVYYIDIKRNEEKNTRYDQFFCEEPRNQYNCNDTVSLHCVKRGMQWNPWQYREVKIAGNTIYQGAQHLGYAIFWKKKRWGPGGSI